MKKIMLIACVLVMAGSGFSQSGLYKKKPTLSVNFMLNDFKTAQSINKTSLSTVFKNRSWSKFTDMSPGLAINYFDGLTDHFDFMASMGASILDYDFKNRQNLGSDYFLLETDASIMAKLFSDKYKVNPYLSAGVGVSLYKVYWGAYVPIGAGLQFKLAENTFLNTQLQYRAGITDLASNHINYSIGFGTPIGSGKKN